jgi:hypothetical protein
MKGWTIRLKSDDTQRWEYYDDFNVRGFVTAVLGYTLDEVNIDGHGLAVTDINDTGITWFYYGNDIGSWPTEQGFVNPTIEFQEDWEAGPVGQMGEQADQEHQDILPLEGQASYQIVLHEDSDPEATLTESEWRAYRVALRAYNLLSDSDIISTPRPVV